MFINLIEDAYEGYDVEVEVEISAEGEVESVHYKKVDITELLGALDYDLDELAERVIRHQEDEARDINYQALRDER